MSDITRIKEREYSTRQDILQLLKSNGEMTADELAQALGITAVAVRAHLTTLERDGLVARRTERRPVGRPVHAYLLTRDGDELFPRNYGPFAIQALKDIRDEFGEAAVEAVFRRRAARQRAAYQEAAAAATLAERGQKLVERLEANGNMARWIDRGDGTFELVENNCPIALVAKDFPLACQLELGVFRDVLQADLTRTRHAVAGDRQCVYLVRGRAGDAAEAHAGGDAKDSS